jgi:hypothetical protein
MSDITTRARKLTQGKQGPMAGLIRELADEVDRLQPRQITTTVELDALPAGSVLLDDSGAMGRSGIRRVWWRIGDNVPVLPPLPALLLWTPEED